MELTQSQISEIISNYTSSSKGFITLQSLIMNSLMGHERDLFVKANEHKQCNGLRSRRWYSHGFEFSLRIPRSRSGNFYLVFSGLIRSEAKNMQGFQSILHQRAYSGQIDGNSEAIYGHIYSKQQVSYLSNSYREDVE